MTVHHSIRSQWLSALWFCLFAIMPVVALVHYLTLEDWMAILFSPIVFFSARVSVSQLAAALTEYELSDTEIRKIMFGRVVGVLSYDDIEKFRSRENLWFYVKGKSHTFFFLQKMKGFEECVEFLKSKLQRSATEESYKKELT